MDALADFADRHPADWDFLLMNASARDGREELRREREGWSKEGEGSQILRRIKTSRPPSPRACVKDVRPFVRPLGGYVPDNYERKPNKHYLVINSAC